MMHAEASCFISTDPGGDAKAVSEEINVIDWHVRPASNTGAVPLTEQPVDVNMLTQIISRTESDAVS